MQALTNTKKKEKKFFMMNYLQFIFRKIQLIYILNKKYKLKFMFMFCSIFIFYYFI
jgi:hypothetical protein